MHSDHDVFVQAVQLRSKIQLAFFAEERGYQSGVFIPLGYRPGTADEPECYCFWEPRAGRSDRPLTLSAEEIAVMQSSEDTYEQADLPPLDSQEFSWLFERPHQSKERNRFGK